MRTLNVKVQTLNVKGALKPVIATVTFPILSITKIRIDRLLDSLGLDDHLGYRFKEDIPIHAFIDRIARRKVDMILAGGGKEPHEELAYEDEGTQYCKCTLTNLAEVSEWVDKAKRGEIYDAWHTGNWGTRIILDKKAGTLRVLVFKNNKRKNLDE